MMNEKKAVVADVLQIPLNDYDTIAEVCLSTYNLPFPIQLSQLSRMVFFGKR